MKLNCEIIAVSTNGESLIVDLQGKSRKDADWRPLNSMRIAMACTPMANKTFYVGRKLELTVKVK